MTAVLAAVGWKPAIGELVCGLAWPALVAYGAWLFREPLGDLIRRLHQAEGPRGPELHLSPDAMSGVDQAYDDTELKGKLAALKEGAGASEEVVGS